MSLINRVRQSLDVAFLAGLSVGLMAAIYFLIMAKLSG